MVMSRRDRRPFISRVVESVQDSMVWRVADKVGKAIEADIDKVATAATERVRASLPGSEGRANAQSHGGNAYGPGGNPKLSGFVERIGSRNRRGRSG